jgi:hypothetical protein
MDFWELHGWGFLFCIAFFPRLTMLFTGICAAVGGPWFWIGWVLAPRIVVAILACITYWTTNPVLCVIAVLLCISGESTEKKSVCKTRS